MDRVLTPATIGKARRSLAARRSRIEALATFARASSGAASQQFVEKLIAALGQLAWHGGARSPEALGKIADLATRHYDAELEEPATAGFGPLDGDPDALAEAEEYGRRITLGAARFGDACRSSVLPSDFENEFEPLIAMAVAIYMEISGPNLLDIATDVLADLHHWCADRGLPLPIRPWS